MSRVADPFVRVSVSTILSFPCCRLIQWVHTLINIPFSLFKGVPLAKKVGDCYYYSVVKVVSLCWKPIAIWYKWHVFFLWKRVPSSVCVHSPFAGEWVKKHSPCAAFGDGRYPGETAGRWALLSRSLSCFTGQTAMALPPFQLSLTLASASMSVWWSSCGCGIGICTFPGVRKCTCGPTACLCSSVCVLCLLCLTHLHSFQLEKEKTYYCDVLKWKLLQSQGESWSVTGSPCAPRWARHGAATALYRGEKSPLPLFQLGENGLFQGILTTFRGHRADSRKPCLPVLEHAGYNVTR